MTMRRELRETLQWCINQHFPFMASDVCEHFEQDAYLVNRKMRTFVKMGLLEREQVIGSGMPFKYRLVNKESAIALASKLPKPKYRAAPKPKRITPSGCSFIFHMGA